MVQRKKISMKQQQMYNLVYIVNGKVTETLMENTTLTLCKWKQRKAKDSGSYKNGLLQNRKVK